MPIPLSTPTGTVRTTVWWTWGTRKHYRISHGTNEFARGSSHINGIENFWGIAKVRLAKYRGMDKRTFYLHLKETEFRYNYRNEDMYKKVLELLRKVVRGQAVLVMNLLFIAMTVFELSAKHLII